MKKVYKSLVLAALLISFQSSAQLAVGLNLGLLKSTEENSESHFGGEFIFEKKITTNIQAGVNVGFYQSSEEVLGIKFKSNLMPFSAFGEYLFLEGDFRPYVGLHLGALRATAKADNTSSSNTYFSLAPTVGADYMVADQIGINVNIKYGFAFFNNDITDELDKLLNLQSKHWSILRSVITAITVLLSRPDDNWGGFFVEKCSFRYVCFPRLLVRLDCLLRSPKATFGKRSTLDGSLLLINTHNMKLIGNLKIIALLALVQVSFHSSAQVSVGLNAGIVKQSFFSPFYGGELSVNYSINDVVRLGANTGFYHHQSNVIVNLTTDEVLRSTSRLIPVTVSSEFVLTKKKLKPYVGAHVGLLYQSYGTGEFKGSRSHLLLSPVVGLDYQVTPSIGINANFKYSWALSNDATFNGLNNFRMYSPTVGVRHSF